MTARPWWRWTVLLVLLAALCLLAAWRMGPQGPLQTDVLTLLPGQFDTPAQQTAAARSRTQFSGQLLALVRGPDKADTHKAATAAWQVFRDAGLKANNDSETIGKALSLYQEHAHALLDQTQITRFESQGAKALATTVAVSLASPAGLVDLATDPGGYAARFLRQLPRPYPDFLPDGPFQVAHRDGQALYLLRLQLPGGGYDRQAMATATSATAGARAAVARNCPSCQMLATGAPLFADAARHQASRESLWLSLTSTLLIMLLIAWAYRSLAPHLLGFLQLGASVTAAAAAVIAVFGSIHILTLVFGTTLLGIAIDYAFLYFSGYWFGGGSPDTVWPKVRPGLVVGLLTGVLSFACLALTGFPALAQVAVFSVAGLVAAALVVALIFPLSLTRPPTVPTHALVRGAGRFLRAACQPSRARWLLPLVALLLAAPGWWQLQAHDEVRELSHFPPALMQADHDLRQALGRQPASGYFLVHGQTLDAALTHEAALFERLQKTLPQAEPLGLSRFLPPATRQEASLAAWRELLAAPNELAKAFAAMGLPPALAGRIRQGWQAAPQAPLTANALFAAVPELERLVLPAKDGVTLMATVFATQAVSTSRLEAAAAGVPGVHYVASLERIDQVFAKIRQRAMLLVLLGYLLISAILIWRYGWREGLRMLYPPALALALTLGVLGWLGVPLNIFSVVALILILGLGRDYAVFLREIGTQDNATALAVLLSALTTIIGFGLLAFSQIPALHAFGLATGIGILFSYLATPLSLPSVDREHAP